MQLRAVMRQRLHADQRHAWLRARLSSPQMPMPGAIEIEIDHWCGVERQNLAAYQPAEDGDAQGLAEFAAFAEPDHQWNRAEQGGHGGHHDRPEAPQAGFEDRIGRRRPAAFGIDREVDHHDGIFLHNADQKRITPIIPMMSNAV